MKLLEQTLDGIQPVSKEWATVVRDYIGRLTMPYWAMGDVLDLVVQLSVITKKLKFKVDRKGVFIFSADHGIASRGVSKYPAEVTKQMVLNFLHGGAAINAIASVAKAKIIVVDMGVNQDFTDSYSSKFLNRKIAFGTNDFSKTPAMSNENAVKSIEVGIKLVEDYKDSFDVFSAGDMGIGNTTSSSAILKCISGMSTDDVVGLGTGIDENVRQAKVRLIEEALERYKGKLTSPIQILSHIGGFEIGAIAGMILGCAKHSKPFVLDGFVASAGALIADQLCSYAKDFIIAGHLSQEKAHGYMLGLLRKKPLLSMNMRLGEGSGATLAMPILDVASAIVNDMATFEDANVSKAKE